MYIYQSQKVRMPFKILIMGLPGSGKTLFAKKLITKLTHVLWINADVIRKSHDDWDFSESGRIRQSIRLASIANDSECDYIICDFVAPLPEQRKIFDADYTIWMNTISEGRYADTNQLFTPPIGCDYTVNSFDNIHVATIAKMVICLNI